CTRTILLWPARSIGCSMGWSTLPIVNEVETLQSWQLRVIAPSGHGDHTTAHGARYSIQHRGWRPHVLWSQFYRALATHCGHGGQDSAGHETSQSPSRRSYKIRACHQSDNREGAWADNPCIIVVACR